LQRLVRLVADEEGVHSFLHRATADQGVVDEAMALTRMLLGGQDIPEACRQLCRRILVDESLLRARLWAVASLFPDRGSPIAGPYHILGVEPSSGQDAVRQAFRALCRQWHPDHNQGDPEAATRFRQIKTAFDMVNDSAGARGWGPPPGVNAWGEPGPCGERKTWPRLRRLTPLAAVVVLLVLTVGGADFVFQYLRPGFAPRETSRAVNVPPDMKPATGEDEALPGAREPLVLPGATSWQSAVGTADRPASLATGAAQGTPSRPNGAVVLQDSVKLDEERGGGAADRPAYPATGGRGDSGAAQGTPSRPNGAVVLQDAPKLDEEWEGGAASGVAVAHGKVVESYPKKAHENMEGLRDAKERLAMFIAAYVRDYSRRDLEGLMRHFAPSALENGTPIKSLRLRYEESFRNIPAVRYSIMVDSMSVGPDHVRFTGRCELRGVLADGKPIAMNGTLHMDLEPFGATFRVRSLQYAIR
jgi:hypothetical protein